MVQNDIDTNGSTAPEFKAVHTGDMWQEAAARQAVANADIAKKAQAPVNLEATVPAVASPALVVAECDSASESAIATTVEQSVTLLADAATVGVNGKYVGPNAVEAATVVSIAATIGVTETLPAVIENKGISEGGEFATVSQHFPHSLPHQLDLVRGSNGTAYSVRSNKKNRFVLAVGSRALNNVIREIAQDEGMTLKQSTIGDVNHYLQAKAEVADVQHDIWYRVAAISGGIEIDLGCADHVRVRITAGEVEVVETGSETLFFRTTSMQAMVRPAAVGNLKLLRKYVNLDSVAFLLYTAWLSYTLAHPKVATSKFVILVIHGGEGCGKSNVSKLSIRLVDPRNIGVQTLPSNGKDLAIATQNAHLNFYDNVRGISQVMSDNLCIAATGGAITTRQLYTNADQHVSILHGAMGINGIYSFIDQPDLAQRSLPLHLNPLKEELRKSESAMDKELEIDLPAIQRGLFDLIASVLEYLPKATVTSPTRMIQFSQWLAAMEMAQSAPVGTFQDVYCEALSEGQRDALLDNSLAAAVLELGEALQEVKWSGTPTELLAMLNSMVSPGTQRSRFWPENAIALSKRLAPLQTSLLSQGISLVLSRGKHRTVTIQQVSGARNA